MHNPAERMTYIQLRRVSELQLVMEASRNCLALAFALQIRRRCL